MTLDDMKGDGGLGVNASFHWAMVCCEGQIQ